MNNDAGKEQRQRKNRFNVIDLIIILVIAAALVGIFLRFDLGRRFNAENSTTEAVVTFFVNDIRGTSADYIVAGEPVYDSETGNFIGTITGSPTVSEAEVYTTDVNGQSVKMYSESGRISVYFQVLSSGMYSDDGFFYGGTSYIAPGKEIIIRTDKLELESIVTDITVAKD